MMSKTAKIATDDILENFYKALSSRDGAKLFKFHIPRSEVFYARAAIEADTGVRYSLDRIERSMLAEGLISRDQVLDPDRKRKFKDACGTEYEY